MEQLLDSCIAPSTRKAYKSAQRRYSAFCLTYNVSPQFPLQEEVLCSYVAYLAQQQLKYRTIKAYLSGIRCLQIQKAMGNPFADGMPRLEYVLTGIKRTQALNCPQARSRLPITIDIMRHL